MAQNLQGFEFPMNVSINFFQKHYFQLMKNNIKDYLSSLACHRFNGHLGIAYNETNIKGDYSSSLSFLPKNFNLFGNPVRFLSQGLITLHH